MSDLEFPLHYKVCLILPKMHFSFREIVNNIFLENKKKI